MGQISRGILRLNLVFSFSSEGLADFCSFTKNVIANATKPGIAVRSKIERRAVGYFQTKTAPMQTPTNAPAVSIMR